MLDNMNLLIEIMTILIFGLFVLKKLLICVNLIIDKIGILIKISTKRKNKKCDTREDLKE